MNKSAVIKKLRGARSALERMGVRHIALCGSLARGEAGKSSDVDVLVRFDRDAAVSLLDVVHVENELSDLLGRRVQVLREPVSRTAADPPRGRANRCLLSGRSTTSRTSSRTSG